MTTPPAPAPLKPGFKTSEFIITVLGAVAAFSTSSTGVLLTSLHPLARLVLGLAGLLATTVLILVYGKGRTALKLAWMQQFLIEIEDVLQAEGGTPPTPPPPASV